MAWPPRLAGLVAICLAGHAGASAANFMQRETAGSRQALHEKRVAAEMPCLGPWCAIWVTPVREHRDALIFENKNMEEVIARLSEENLRLKGERDGHAANEQALAAKNEQLGRSQALYEAVHPHIHDRMELQDVVSDIHSAKADDASFVELFKTTTASLLEENKNLQESMHAVTRNLEAAAAGRRPDQEMRMKSFVAGRKARAKMSEMSDMREALVGQVDRFSEETAKLAKAILDHNQGTTNWAARAQSTSRMAKVLQQLQELVDTYQLQKHKVEKENKALQDDVKNLTQKISELEGVADQCKDNLVKVRTEMDQKCHEEKTKIGELLETRTGSQKKLIDACNEEKKQLETGFGNVKKMMMEGFEAERYQMFSNCSLQTHRLQEDLHAANNSIKSIQGKCETEKKGVMREVTQQITMQCNEQLAEKAKEKQAILHKNEDLRANSDKVLGHYKDLWEEFQTCNKDIRGLKQSIGAVNRLKDEAESRAVDIQSTRKRVELEKEGCAKRKNEMEEAYARVLAAYNRCKSNMTQIGLQNQELTNTLQDAMNKLDQKTSMIKQAQDARDHCEVTVSKLSSLKDKLGKVNAQLSKEKLGMEKQLEEALGGFENLFPTGDSNHRDAGAVAEDTMMPEPPREATAEVRGRGRRHRVRQKSVDEDNEANEVRAKWIQRPDTGSPPPFEATTSGARRSRKPLPPPFEDDEELARLRGEKINLLAQLAQKPDDRAPAAQAVPAQVPEDLAMHKMSVGSARKPVAEDNASLRGASLSEELDSLISQVATETTGLKQKHRQLEGTIEALGSEGGGADVRGGSI